MPNRTGELLQSDAARYANIVGEAAEGFNVEKVKRKDFESV